MVWAGRLALAGLLGVLRINAEDGAAPQQPVPFNHKLHLGLNLKCVECHPNANPGENMGLPAASKCMACHISIASDRPDIQKLKALAKSRAPISWVRLYSVPAYVYWNHRTHLQASVACIACHGDVPTMEVARRVGNATTMGGCVDCHRKSKASTGCESCHEERN